MQSLPDAADAAVGPPLWLPVAHVLVALGFLLAGTVAAAVVGLGLGGPARQTAVVHLLLVGWVCLTIMGAMAQFLPVWSNVALHSLPLAVLQLVATTVGVALLATALWTGTAALLPVAAAVLAAGIGAFVYGTGRTLAPALREGPDVTEAHFAVALASFALVATLGVTVVAHQRWGVLADVPIVSTDLVAAHVTLAVFGAVGATVVGALFQLAPMLTGHATGRVDVACRRLETATYPAGVALLAVGRLLGDPLVARVGAAGLLVGLAALAVALAYTLRASTAGSTAVRARYWLATAALAGWLALTAPSLLAAPLDHTALLGPDPTAAPLLVVGVVGSVVLGTLYHVVPFLVWLDRYSDRVGLEPVPAVDDLYRPRVAHLDLATFGAGLAVLSLAPLAPPWLPTRQLGGGLLAATAFVVVANLGLVVLVHAPGPEVYDGDRGEEST